MWAQIVTKMTHEKAQPGSPSHSTGLAPAAVITPLSRPSRCRIHFQISATTTGDSSTG